MPHPEHSIRETALENRSYAYAFAFFLASQHRILGDKDSIMAALRDAGRAVARNQVPVPGNDLDRFAGFRRYTHRGRAGEEPVVLDPTLANSSSVPENRRVLPARAQPDRYRRAARRQGRTDNPVSGLQAATAGGECS